MFLGYILQASQTFELTARFCRSKIISNLALQKSHPPPQPNLIPIFMNSEDVSRHNRPNLVLVKIRCSYVLLLVYANVFMRLI